MDHNGEFDRFERWQAEKWSADLAVGLLDADATPAKVDEQIALMEKGELTTALLDKAMGGTGSEMEKSANASALAAGVIAGFAGEETVDPLELFAGAPELELLPSVRGARKLAKAAGGNVKIAGVDVLSNGDTARGINACGEEVVVEDGKLVVWRGKRYFSGFAHDAQGEEFRTAILL